MEEEKRRANTAFTEDGVELWKDKKGGYIPKSLIEDVDVLRDEMVRSIIEEVEEEAARLKALKQKCYKIIEDFMELSMSQYGVESKAVKGNLTFKTYDGEMLVEINNQENIEFDEQIHAAKALIDKCIERWAKGANLNLAVLVTDAFKVNKKGLLDTRRILALRNYKIEDEDWKKAMDAIDQSIKETSSKKYMRFYHGRNGDEKLIPVNISWSTI